ncbi:MAG: hypothetical protein CMP14_00510 [Rickettsiales bacterium]|jgi:hypothetical protein|nr:hypothetical protein [Rickettsiales bacterium]
MTKRTPNGQKPGGLTNVDQLFGRDLRRNGWFIEESLSSGGWRRPSMSNNDWPTENSPDPAVIWALRNRRRV